MTTVSSRRTWPPTQRAGFRSMVRVTPPMTATPDYSDGDAVGGLMEFANVVREGANSGAIERIAIKSKIAPGVGVVLHLFDASPSASTYADNGALSIHANDFPKIVRSIVIASADFVDVEAGGYQVEKAVNIPFSLASGTSLFGIIEADGTINAGSASDFEVQLGISGD